MSWDEALKFEDALTSRGVKLIAEGDNFRAEPRGVLTDEEKATVGRLRAWLLCNAAVAAMARRVAAASTASAPHDAVARARQIAAEEAIDQSVIAGDVAATRKACAQLLQSLGLS